PPVVAVATAVEDDLGDPGVGGAGGEQLADRLGALDVAAVGAQVGLEGGGRGHGATGAVVDHLGRDVLVGAEDGQARPLGGPLDLLADPTVTTDPGLSLLLCAVAHRSYFAVLPALRATCSP